MNQLCLAGIVAVISPVDPFTSGMASGCPSWPQKRIVKLTVVGSRLTNAKLVLHPAPSATCAKRCTVEAWDCEPTSVSTILFTDPGKPVHIPEEFRYSSKMQ